MEIYEPAEDSYLLSSILEKVLKNLGKKIKILDMGSGSGIQAETCKNLGFNDILTVDINQDSVKNLRKKGFKAINSNLFSKINKNKKFDVIIFNPPYLPENRFDKNLDVSGGKEGYELIIKFLRQARYYLNKKGFILLLFSSVSKPKIIKSKAKEYGFKLILLKKQKIFFEELYIYKLYL
ncbi:MAG: Rossmann-like fold-containing protein [Candidatus Pacearchaeota archaeon]